VDEKELIFRIYQSQKNSPNSGDWIKLVNADKDVLGIEIDDEEMRYLSKNKFEKYIENKIEKYALLQLNVLKAKHQKSQYLDSNSFKTAQYLIDDRFRKSEANLLFKLRSKTLNLRMNYENQHSNTLCQICGLFPESQAHLLQCPRITPMLKLYLWKC
jgi:prenyltransferase beta subunit